MEAGFCASDARVFLPALLCDARGGFLATNPVDALGLGAYAAFGVQKALTAGLPPPAAVLVGVVNAIGGGLLRDVLTREEPLVFKPGQFYLLTALAGAVGNLSVLRRMGDSNRLRLSRLCLS